jgi:ribosome-binding factor A
VYLVPYENLSHETYQKAFERLKLYKPSIRKELAEKLNQRHTPDIKFLFDESKEKQYKIEKLLDKIHDELTFQKK